MSAPRRVLTTVALLCLAFAEGSSIAAAQSIEVNRFRPAPVHSDGLAVSGAEVPGHLHWDLALHLDYARDPLIVELATKREYSVISDQFSTHLSFALGLGERAFAFLGLPVNLVMSGDDPPAGIVTRLPRPDGFGFGDAYLGGRVRVWNDAAGVVALAVQGMLSLPLASLNTDQLYSGDDAVGGQARAILDVNYDRFSVRANAGARVRQDERLHSSIVGDELIYGLGLQYKLVRGKLRLLADLFGGVGFRRRSGGLEAPLEATLGARYVAGSGMYAGLGVGPGLIHGVGAPEWRALVSVGFATSLRAQPTVAPLMGRKPIAPSPELLDDDRDGVANAIDACPAEQEDRDGFDDFDGCPDPDNDRDSIADELDRCPTQAEDPDNYEDQDGCPDTDNDADGVLDAADKCPLEPGDVKAEGCVPPPAQAVPPPTATLPSAHIQFARGKDRLPAGGVGRLQEFKRALDADPGQPVRIEGYGDAGGKAASNLRLSTRRARAIGRWLISQGIAPERIQLVTCGQVQEANMPAAQDNAQIQRAQGPAEAPADCVPVSLTQ